MSALVLLAQETGEQTLGSFPGRCQGKMGQLEHWGQALASDSEECRARRGCHWGINSPNRRAVNSTAPTGREITLVSHPGTHGGEPERCFQPCS